MRSEAVMPDTQKIRELNDQFRNSFCGGNVLMSRGVAARDDIPEIINRVRTFDQFDEDSSPHGENDFGTFDIHDQKFFFKLDYYAHDLEHGSDDPSDPTITTRVLTIMLAEEY
jgi:hypothetical protein